MADDADFFWQAITALPRQPLMHGVTPLQPMCNLRQTLGGPAIWCKRDDLISFGLGGNKIRGLELLAADALKRQADVLVSGAGVQSNHVRATAATAAYLGLSCVAVFWGNPPQGNEGNYRVTRMLGAETVFTGDVERSSVDAGIQTQCEVLRNQGLHPYAIPRGGACALGALGHALAAREVYQQCRSQNIEPSTIILATGSGGTHAGWLLGTRALGDPWKIESFTVSREAVAVRTEITRLATEAAKSLGLDWHFSEQEVIVHGGFIGEGYGIPSREGAKAIRFLCRTEGILLDPTYTGKAMAGLLNQLECKADFGSAVIFLHTGGEPAFFAGDGAWLDYSDSSFLSAYN